MVLALCMPAICSHLCKEGMEYAADVVSHAAFELVRQAIMMH